MPAAVAAAAAAAAAAEVVVVPEGVAAREGTCREHRVASFPEAALEADHTYHLEVL